MPDNKQILKAQKDKKNEFYTPLELIEKELPAYHHLLENKTIYCNCDSYRSSFFIYFYNNYFKLKLKKLIFTGLNSKKIIIDKGIMDVSKLGGKWRLSFR